ncbi:MAG: PHP domain-containing protein, partial [Natronosporangium sp.]
MLADLGHWVVVSTGKEKGKFPQGVSERDYRWYHVSYTPRRSYSRTLADTHYIYRPIRDVVAVELDCEVFNLQVEEDNSYVSDFVLHNCEAYVAPESRFHKRPVAWGEPHQRGDDISGGGAYTHLTLLAADAEGLRNLFRLSSRSSIEGFYQRPRMDWELLAEYAGGVIASTGCPGGEVQTRLRLGQYDKAVAAAARLREIFGPEQVFLELMDHGGEVERRVRDDLLRLGKELGLPPLATNDTHYVVPDESKAHEALL